MWNVLDLEKERSLSASSSTLGLRGDSSSTRIISPKLWLSHCLDLKSEGKALICPSKLPGGSSSTRTQSVTLSLLESLDLEWERMLSTCPSTLLSWGGSSSTRTQSVKLSLSEGLDLE